METKDLILLLLGGLLALIVNMFTPKAMSLLSGGRAVVSERSKKRALRAYRQVRRRRSDPVATQIYFTQMWGLINGLLIVLAVICLLFVIKGKELSDALWSFWIVMQVYGVTATLLCMSMINRLIRLSQRLRDFDNYRAEVIKRFGPNIDEEGVAE